MTRATTEAVGMITTTASTVIAAVSDLTGFSQVDLRGYSRCRPLVQWRHIAMYVIRGLTDLSYAAIGREFDGRDHTTVIHAVQKIEGDRSRDAGTRRAVERVLHRLEVLDGDHQAELVARLEAELVPVIEQSRRAAAHARSVLSA